MLVTLANIRHLRAIAQLCRAVSFRFSVLCVETILFLSRLFLLC